MLEDQEVPLAPCEARSDRVHRSRVPVASVALTEEHRLSKVSGMRDLLQLLNCSAPTTKGHRLTRRGSRLVSLDGSAIPWVLTMAWVLAGCPGSPSVSRGTVGDTSKVVVMHFQIKGMHCTGCAAGIRSELLQVPGVASARVRYPEADAEVKAHSPLVDPARLIRVIEEAGYHAVRVP